jgi:hypothetical protein
LEAPIELRRANKNRAARLCGLPFKKVSVAFVRPSRGFNAGQLVQWAGGE